jgi:hypothetical protein
MGKKLTDMTVFHHGHLSTPLAVCVSEDEDSKKVWLPKSQIEIEDASVEHGPINITLPQWLAEEKGLA